jgi:hypothetical protein
MPDYVKPTHADSRITIQPHPQGLIIEYQRDPYVHGVITNYRESAMMLGSKLSPADLDLLKQVLDMLLDRLSQQITPLPSAPPASP